jgi:hypothetical protein
MITTLREAMNTPFAWPGGYPIYATLDDGEMICYECLNNCPELHEGGLADGWRFEGADVYWEGETLRCCHCNQPNIESAYGNPEE